MSANGEDVLIKRVDVGLLVEYYGALLSKKQREALELYCNEDYSLAEIAEVMNVSRQAAFDAVHKACAHLVKYESALNLIAQNQREQAVRDALSIVIERLCGEMLPGERRVIANDAIHLINQLGGDTHGV